MWFTVTLTEIRRICSDKSYSLMDLGTGEAVWTQKGPQPGGGKVYAIKAAAVMPDGSAGIASGYFGYQPDEAYDLYYGRASLHTAGNEGAADNQAADVAERLLEIP